MFFWNSLAFLMIQWMLAIWCLVPLPSLYPASTSGSSWFMYLWRLAWRSLSHYFASVWDECKCVVFWTPFGIAFPWDGMKTDLFHSCRHFWVFQICWHIECSTLTASSLNSLCAQSSCITVIAQFTLLCGPMPGNLHTRSDFKFTSDNHYYLYCWGWWFWRSGGIEKATF